MQDEIKLYFKIAVGWINIDINSKNDNLKHLVCITPSHFEFNTTKENQLFLLILKLF